MFDSDIQTLRDLARRYAELAADDIMTERRDLWRRHNSLHPTRPLIYVRAFAFHELQESECVCEDPVLRGVERKLRHDLLWATFEDDAVFEPWVTVSASLERPPNGIWGLTTGWAHGGVDGGSKVPDVPIREPGDAEGMVMPWHKVNQAATEANYTRVHDAIGDLLPVNLDPGPLYRGWYGDISTQLFYLRGMENFLMDMMLQPEWLHRVLAFMRDGILKTHEEAEQAGDWTLAAHANQAMPYAEELDDPKPNLPRDGVRHKAPRNALWYFCASQEFTAVGPEQFDEFMFRYQEPILRPFGLVAYGCCEDLALKIPLLKRLQNLRRIAVSPMTNVARCAEQIGDAYVLSYRPSPADMVSYDFDPDRVRRILRRDLETCAGCHVDITLKDVQTVEGDPGRVREWVRICREVMEEPACSGALA
jgi:hypothetical protein